MNMNEVLHKFEGEEELLQAVRRHVSKKHFYLLAFFLELGSFVKRPEEQFLRTCLKNLQ